MMCANDCAYRGFNEVTSANGVYYQLWQNGKPTINTGATGLQNFGALGVPVALSYSAD